MLFARKEFFPRVLCLLHTQNGVGLLARLAAWKWRRLLVWVCKREREKYLKYLKKSLFARWLKRKNKCLCREYSVALWGVLLLHCWPPVLLVWTQLFGLCCWSSNIFTCLIISKQVTHEVCCTVILSLTKYFSVVCNGEMLMYLILATWSSLVEGNGWLGSAQFTNKFGYCPWQTMSIVLAFRIC